MLPVKLLNTIQNFSLSSMLLPITPSMSSSHHSACPFQKHEGHAEEVVPLSDEGITDVETYHSCLSNLHSQAVIEAKTNLVPNRVLGAFPPDISPLQSLLHTDMTYHCSTCHTLPSSHSLSVSTHCAFPWRHGQAELT